MDNLENSGGLSLWWKDKIDVVLQSLSKGHIDALVRDEEGHARWLFIGFYGHLETDALEESWQLMRWLGHGRLLLWIYAGISMRYYWQQKKWQS